MLEYGELADLVHEYNATVINNRLEYDDYGARTTMKMKMPTRTLPTGSRIPAIR